MDCHSSHSPPTFSGLAEGDGDLKKNSSNGPENQNNHGDPQSVDVVFPPRLFACNGSYSSSSSSDDDSTHETLAGTSSLKYDPSNEGTSTDADKLLLKELQQLSVNDRGRVQEEIHGVSTCAIVEDENKIIEGLKCLENEIRTIRREVFLSLDHVSSAGNSYSKSIWPYLAVDEENSSSSTISTNAHKRMLYSYIFHEEFRLRFLRADLYDAKKAAHRYLRCIESLLKYYGNYALQRPLIYEDLGKECQDAAKTGFMQVLPSRDRAGRLVVVCQPVSKEAIMSIVVKLFVYIFQVVSEDIETQKRGCIFVFSADEEQLELLSIPEAKHEYSLYREGSMVRRSCTHFCLPENNPKMKIARSIIMLAMSRDDRIRTRIHMEGKFAAISHRNLKIAMCIQTCTICFMVFENHV